MKSNKNVIGVGCDALFAVAMPDTRGAFCYLTTGDGDPPRTYTPEHANRYKSERAAKAAMTRARKKTPLKDRFMVVVPHPANAEVWDGDPKAQPSR